MYRYFFVIAAIVFVPNLAAPAQDKQPTAEEILDRYVEVTGGKEAYEKLKNRRATGTVELKGAGLRGQVTVIEAPEAKSIATFDLPGIGKMEEGTDGTVAWEKSVITGAKLKTGDEKAHAIRSAYFHGDTQWRKVFNQVKCVGSKRVEDKECWRLEMTTPEGLVFEKFFDQKTGLLVLLKVTIKTPQMEVPTEIYPGDYQKVDGILYPHEMRMKALTQELVIRVAKLEHNVDLPADTFALPKDIQELLDKSK
jgi:hypothetical protein